MRKNYLSAIISASLLAFLCSCSNTAKDNYHTIKFADKTLKVTLCATNEKRNKIANYLLTIKDGEGYLLCYPRERLQAFYAGSISLNGSVAFINSNSEITEIQEYSKDGVLSSMPAKFVLVTAQGWFDRNNVKIGAKAALPQEALSPEELYTVKIKDESINVELAITDTARRQGLKFRKQLNKDEGMLFIYRSSKAHKFWMQDTVVPLSLAYIKSDWTISSIHDLKPFDETEVPSIEPTQFVLEVAQGWFSQHDIKPGDKVSFSANIDDLGVE
ncbi:DUF192 domain-containing protein [Candidatus Peregrinibacteria bacterium]|nr:DUF192 domain-containing protein [Candidatus Peregrinibacteria bacterium]